jgi:hypothetical protein
MGYAEYSFVKAIAKEAEERTRRPRVSLKELLSLVLPVDWTMLCEQHTFF